MDNGNQYCEDKEWLFRENVRLMQEREALEAERLTFEQEKRDRALENDRRETSIRFQMKRLDMERQLFDKKLEILEREYRRLADDKQQFESIRKDYEAHRSYRSYRTVKSITSADADILFKGVNNELALKKRYRDLLKIFHPDNLNGDAEVIQDINKEYDSLKRMYC